MKRALFTLLGVSWVCQACSPSEPQTGSQTNWIKACDASAECGPLSCVCRTCTRPCDDDTGCADLEGASCVPAEEAGAVAVCGGRTSPTAGLCLARCDNQTCVDGAVCVAGVCTPTVESTARVTIDLGVRSQTLVGFGAGLAYAEDEIVAHPEKEALLDLVFDDLGLDVLRLRNRFDGDNAVALASAAEIVAAATDRLGRAPTVLLNEGSPPPELKANGARVCAGNPDTCTLVTLPGGGFDYAGLAEHWRTSLVAHTDAGIPIDYLAIQNNPNYLPPESNPTDACYFLPVEGTRTVTVGGAEVEVSYPGFVEALAAVLEATIDLPDAPSIVAPEVSGVRALSEYEMVLGVDDIDAFGYHLYDVDPMAVDEDAVARVAELGAEYERPTFQTEMRADGFGTAILMQSALTLGGASTYLQNDLVASAAAEGGDPNALVSLGTDSFEAETAFHAMRHFARFTDPGWVRVAAESDTSAVLASAWHSPNGESLSVVFVNSGTGAEDVQLDLGEIEEFSSSEVTRTTFDGIERSATLGPMPPSAVVRLPGHSIVTVAFER